MYLAGVHVYHFVHEFYGQQTRVRGHRHRSNTSPSWNASPTLRTSANATADRQRGQLKTIF
ncbi:hypothetical protein CY34DRAFT_242248 [Suillus luteus UH-Slu-Lm8-n1]|uniref:Uncharacterized protein n=1 Tax=Suillus luteus UH-Slu-Lm8-n1 TaxID=930992 RepID=A0A0D0AGI3_9AGAM|nr:hypothetical protein CY34DRAFT_242248 [Suillus luteus UH-Slu-Lm8-n1]